MKVTETTCKTILTRATGYLREVCSHSLNPYTGCGFGRSGCGVGCYVQFNPWINRGRDWGDFVDVKINAPEVYRATSERESCWARKHRGTFSIFLSSSTEPWQPAEKQFRITRRLLEAMRDQPPDELILQTHGTGIRDDLELVAELSELFRLRVHVSLEGDLLRLPGLPAPPSTFDDRLELIQELSAHGLRGVACLSPLYPLQEPEAFFKTLVEAGCSAVVVDHFIQGDGTADGSRTLQSSLPKAMENQLPESVSLDYRDFVIRFAQEYLPVGVSASGFAGRYMFAGKPVSVV